MNGKQKVEIANLVGDIHALACMINMTTEMAVFTRISGHVETMSIDLRASKENYDKRLTSDSFNLRSESDHIISSLTPERTIIRLKKVKSELRKILRKGEIDYKRLNYTERVEHDYHLG